MAEKFCDLLESYLDEEQIKMKWEEDEKDEVYKEETPKGKKPPFQREHTISMQEYAKHYLGLPGNYETLLHCGLKTLHCPYVVGVDNRFANKNPELVYQGFLLLVLDYKQRRGTYINPIYLKRMITKSDEKTWKALEKQHVYDLQKLQLYYKKYQLAKEQILRNQAFMDLLKDLHKTKKIEEIKEFDLCLERKKL